MQVHNVGDMLFSRRYGIGTIIKLIDRGEMKIEYTVEWDGGEYGYGEGCIQQLGRTQVEAYKRNLVCIMERYTSGSVQEICGWEKQRILEELEIEGERQKNDEK